VYRLERHGTDGYSLRAAICGRPRDQRVVPVGPQPLSGFWRRRDAKREADGACRFGDCPGTLIDPPWESHWGNDVCGKDTAYNPGARRAIAGSAFDLRSTHRAASISRTTHKSQSVV